MGSGSSTIKSTGLDEITQELKKLIKQKLRICIEDYDGVPRNVVCVLEKDNQCALRLECNLTQSSEIMQNLNAFLVCVIKNQSNLFDSFMMLKSRKEDLNLTEANQSILAEILLHMQQVIKHVDVKQNTLFVQDKGTPLVVHITCQRGIKITKPGDPEERISRTKTFGFEAYHPKHYTIIIQTLCSFVSNADIVIKTITNLSTEASTPTKSDKQLVDDSKPRNHSCDLDKETAQAPIMPSSNIDQACSHLKGASSEANQSKETKKGPASQPGNTNKTVAKPRPNDKTTNKAAKPSSTQTHGGCKNGSTVAFSNRIKPNSQTTAKGNHPRMVVSQATAPKSDSSIIQSVDEVPLEDPRKQLEQEKQNRQKQEEYIRTLKIDNKDFKSRNTELVNAKKALSKEAKTLEDKIKTLEASESRLKSELTKVTKIKNDLQTKSKQHETDIKGLTRRVTDVDQNNSDLLTRNKKLTSEIGNLKSDKNELEKNLELTLQRNEELQTVNSTLTDATEVLQFKVADMTNRLAAEMNTKISANESSLENISIKCRPMNVAEDFNWFVSNVWLDAKQCLDEENIGQEASIQFFCEILMISSAVAHSTFMEGMRFLTNPFGAHKTVETETSGEDKKAHGNILSVVGDNFRRHIDQLDILPLKTTILGVIPDKTKDVVKDVVKILSMERVDKYVEESARLAWAMAIQRPPMTFEKPDIGKPFKGEQTHPLAWGSKPGKGAKIQYYQYPTLLHGDKVMMRGKVCVF